MDKRELGTGRKNDWLYLRNLQDVYRGSDMNAGVKDRTNEIPAVAQHVNDAT